MIVLIWCIGAAAAVTIAHIALAAVAWWQAVLIFLLAYVLANALFALFWLIVGWCVDKTYPIQSVNRLCQIGCIHITQFVCGHCNVHIKVVGEEKLPKDTRFLYVSNHFSGFDPLAAACMLGKYDIAFVSKPSNLKLLLVGNIAARAGYLPIDRENDRNALRTILTAADYMKKDWCSIGIYPEGTRSRTGELGPFHAGSFKIAQKANSPVAIVATDGTQNISKNTPFKPTYVTLTVLDIIPAERVKAMNTAELAEYSRNRIAAQLDKSGADKNGKEMAHETEGEKTE